MSRTETQHLFDYRPAEGAYVLSIYLQTHSAESLTVFQNELAKISHGFEEKSEQHQFQDCVARIELFLRRFEARAETVVIICSATGPLWVRQINVRLPNIVRWGKTPYWKPFVEAIDEFEPFGVLQLEADSAILLTMAFGNVHEHRTLQRTAKEDLDGFLTTVVNATREMLQEKCPNRLVLTGDRDIRSEFLRVAPPALQKSVIGSISVPMRPSAKLLYELTAPIARFAERELEAREVGELIRLARNHKKVALGAVSTLAALNARRVDRLVYAEDFAASGMRCEACQRLFTDTLDICPNCNLAMRPVRDLLAEIVCAALQSDASIEEVRGAAAHRLKDVGGIGAYLRY